METLIISPFIIKAAAIISNVELFETAISFSRNKEAQNGFKKSINEIINQPNNKPSDDNPILITTVAHDFKNALRLLSSTYLQESP